MSRVNEEASKIPRVGDKAPKLGHSPTLIQPREPRRDPFIVKAAVPSGKRDPQIKEGGPRLGMNESHEEYLRHTAEAAQKAAEQQARGAFQELARKAGADLGVDHDEDEDTPFLDALDGDDDDLDFASDDDSEDGSDEPDEADTDLEKARLTLKRAQVPASTIKSLSKEATLDMASRFSALMADQERAFQQANNAAKAVEALTAKSESKEEPTPGKAGQPSTETLEKLRAPLDDELGKSLVDKLLEVVKASVPQIDNTRIEQMERVLDGMTRTNANQMMASQRDRLAAGTDMNGSYPQVNDDAEWRRVVELVEKLAKTGEFNDPNDVFLTAAAAAFGPAQPAQQRRGKRGASNKAKQNGQPNPPKQRARGPHDSSSPAEQVARNVFRHLSRHPGDRKGAKAAASRGHY